MAAIDWPGSLPLPEAGALQEAYVAPFVDDQAQVGASRRRKRFTRSLRSFSITLFLDADQREILEAFVETGTDGGTQIFNWTHPTKGTVYEVRFGSGLPSISHVQVKYWRATFQLDEV